MVWVEWCVVCKLGHWENRSFWSNWKLWFLKRTEPVLPGENRTAYTLAYESNHSYDGSVTT